MKNYFIFFTKSEIYLFPKACSRLWASTFKCFSILKFDPSRIFVWLRPWLRLEDYKFAASLSKIELKDTFWNFMKKFLWLLFDVVATQINAFKTDPWKCQKKLIQSKIKQRHTNSFLACFVASLSSCHGGKLQGCHIAKATSLQGCYIAIIRAILLNLQSLKDLIY